MSSRRDDVVNTLGAASLALLAAAVVVSVLWRNPDDGVSDREPRAPAPAAPSSSFHAEIA